MIIIVIISEYIVFFTSYSVFELDYISKYKSQPITLSNRIWHILMWVIFSINKQRNGWIDEPSLPWGRKVGLNLPQVDCLFGPSLNVKGKSGWLRHVWTASQDSHFAGKEYRPDYASSRSALWTVTFLGRKVALISPLMDRRTLWTVTSLEKKVAWLRHCWMDTLDRHFPGKEEALTWPQIDPLFGPSLLQEEIESERLRGIHSFYRHFPVKEVGLT